MLFHVYGENALPQWIAMLGVLAALILLNEVSRRTKAGGILMFFVIPAILTVYFIAIAVGAKTGASWALNNQTYLYMNGWFHYAKLYAALAGCIGFMMIKYEWGIGKAHWFKAYPFAIVAINKLTAVAAPLRGVRMKGLKSISVSGSNHICMVMILVDTIPGSAAFTTIPLCLTRLAKSMVNRVNASFVLLYIGMRQKPPFFPRRKKSGKSR